MDNPEPSRPPSKFSRETIMNAIGFGLVGVCFIVALFNVLVSKMAEETKDQKVIRIAHWQLEDGIRDAIDKIAEEYSKIHPDVRIEQLTIPERIYTNWFITQLIGGTAPDLVEIQNLAGNNPGRGDTDERLARFFVPITSFINDPNPYNNGTPLQGIPWRETFIDGMSSNYNQSLLETYAIGLNLHTVRVYYNVDLFNEVFGAAARPPESYSEFIAMCKTLEAWTKEHKRPLTAIASSGYNWNSFASRPMQSVMQNLCEKMDNRRTLIVASDNMMTGYLKGVWTLDSPEITSSLDIAHELGGYMTQGFMQLKREDATFYFLQQRAMFIATGSWDIKSLSSQATFPVAVFNVPIPDKSDTAYGSYILDQVAEGVGAGTPFAITRNSKYPEIALDFLKFLSSYRNNRTFSEISMWYPSVVGVEPPAEVKPFAPISNGVPGNPSLIGLGTDTKRLTDNQLHLLFGSGDATKNFVEKIRPELETAILSDLQRGNKTRLQNIGRLDSVLESLAWQSAHEVPGNPLAVSRKLDELSLNQTSQEFGYYNLLHLLNSRTP